MSDDLHITPIGDLVPHTYTRDCWCVPRVDASLPRALVIHQSADGREAYEVEETEAERLTAAHLQKPPS